MNRLLIPYLNPVRFYKANGSNLPNYFHKTFLNYRFEDTQQQPWSQKKTYYQKWQKTDIIPFQFISNFSTLAIEVLDCMGVVKITVNLTPIRADKFNPGWFCYQGNVSLVNLPEGKYRLRIPLGDDTEISDWMEVKTSWPNTLLYEYGNSRYHLGVIFETGIVFRFRIEGTIGRLIPGSADVVYEDQPRNPYTLSSKPFRGYNLSMGGAAGVPDWAVDLLNFIWSCNQVYIDGIAYGKTGDSKFEPKGEKNYPMQAITMTIREGINRPSKIIEPNLNTGKKVVVLNPVDTSVFGELSGGANSNVIVIKSME